MDFVVGRVKEQELLMKAIHSGSPEMVAVYGRRRVGKTFLIRQTLKTYIQFEFSGMINSSKETQLENFVLRLAEVFQTNVNLNVPSSWLQAFGLLKQYLEQIKSKKPVVIFIDEIPWLDNHKSGFIQAFGNFWNTWASTKANMKIIICGSSASWMINKIINSRGGLHNRVTRKIKLQPFNLFETEEFLRRKNINLDRYSILQLYMSIGGIPHYLKEVEKGLSTPQNIANICFSPQGLLVDEYQNLFPALFDHSERHYDVINKLSKKKEGFTRNEIIEDTKLSSGGTTTKVINELVESDFISKVVPFGKREKNSLYRINDEFILFYLKFMKQKSNLQKEDYWLQKINTPSWMSWAGYAFEAICFKHVSQIEHALGISGIYTEVSSWRSKNYKGKVGAQVDLLIDRKDQVVNLIEIKFSLNAYTISKKYNEELKNKVDVFRRQTKTRKSIFLTFLTTYGLLQNQYALSSVQKEILMDTLFVQ